MKNIAIYFPQSNSYFEVGGYLLDKNGKETKIKVEKISVFFGKIKIKLSDGCMYIYKNVSWSCKLN
ncbi:MAG: hypothetical protein WC823_00265 [Parcubacteria group bacterium]|jgi:hypothetical protein